MDVKVTGEVLPYFEWKIPDYFSRSSTLAHNQISGSPSFSYLDSTWRFELYSNGNKKSGPISLYLVKEEATFSEEKILIFNLDLNKSDETLQKKLKTPCFFKTCSNTWVWKSIFVIAILQKFELVLDTLIFKCRLGEEKIKVALTPTERMPQESSECVNSISELETLSSDFRTILMARSPVFRAMFMHDTKEAKEGVVNEPDCDPDSFESFLQYLYTGELLQDIQFRDAHQLYITSDKYDVPKLKSFCALYMVQNVSAENLCEVALLGDLFDDARLASAAETFFIKNFRKVFPTAEWKKLMRTNYQLADRLLEKI